MKRCSVLILSCLLLLTAGCGVTSHLSSERVVVTPHSPTCLWHLKAGRDYAAQGRYELAKEQYLMALAASNTGECSEVANQELKAVDLMIQAQR